MVGIYKIKNKINGKIYIGQSTDIELRFAQHKDALLHSNSSWYPEARLESDSIEDFEFSILQTCNTKELNELEEYWTRYYNSNIYGYNKKLAIGDLILSSDINIDCNDITTIFQIFTGVNSMLDGKCGSARALIYYFILLYQKNITILPRESEILKICNIDHSQYSRTRALLQSRNLITYIPNQSIIINFQTILDKI